MAKHSSRVLRHAIQRAAIRFRRFADELDTLLALTSPDLGDAFDADELPLEFILKRDGGLPDNTAQLRTVTGPRAKGVLRGRKTTYRREQRIADRMQRSPE